jgi:hypothetical protein
MALVRDIDKDIIKQELMKTFYSFAKITNMRLIAEGIETINELNTLIDIGVHYGQGYYLQKPATGFPIFNQHVKEMIIFRNQLKDKAETCLQEMKIGEIARIDKGLEVTSSIGEAYEALKSVYQLQGIAVCNQTQPVGLIMRSKLDLEMALSSKKDELLKEDIEIIMERTPLILDYAISIQEACRKATARREENLYDYVIVTKENQYYGVLSVRKLLIVLNDRFENHK